VILPNIATADAMNRKDAVVRLAQHAVRARAAGGSDPGLASVARDTVAYASVSAFRQSFPASLARASATASSHWSMDASSAIPVQSGAAAAARGEGRETGKQTNGEQWVESCTVEGVINVRKAPAPSYTLNPKRKFLTRNDLKNLYPNPTTLNFEPQTLNP